MLPLVWQVVVLAVAGISGYICVQQVRSGSMDAVGAVLTWLFLGLGAAEAAYFAAHWLLAFVGLIWLAVAINAGASGLRRGT